MRIGPEDIACARSLEVPVTGGHNAITSVTLRIAIQHDAIVWVSPTGLFEAVEGSEDVELGSIAYLAKQMDVDFCDHTVVFPDGEFPVWPLEVAVESVNMYLAESGERGTNLTPAYLVPGIGLSRREVTFPAVLERLISGEIGSAY